MRPWPFLVLLLFLAPTAAAGYEPRFYYLKDDALGPVESGRLNGTVPNATQPSTRAVPLALPNVPATLFQTEAGHTHLERLMGPVYVGLWIGPSPIADGNLTVTLLVRNATATLPIGNATIELDANASKLPEPTALVPPHVTTPEAVLLYELSQLLPVLTPPPTLLHLGTLNVALNASDQLVLTFAVTPGSPDAPVAAGAGATIQYNATLAPSFLYLPWYKPAVTSRSAPSASVSRPYVTYAPGTQPSTETPTIDVGKPSRVPGPEPALLLLGLAAALLVASRRRAP